MRILMATGGSSHSEAALHFGAQLLHAGRLKKTPTILTVIRREADRTRAEKILAHSRQIVEPGLAEIQTKIRLGQAAEEIVSEAEEGQYDLVIVGERQQHDFATRFLLGSTAVRVVEHAPCPVIVAKGKMGPLRRILLCDSGAQDSPLLRCFTEQLGDLIKNEDEMTILHVMSQISAAPGVSGRQLRANAEELIKEHAPEGQLLERDIDLLRRLNVQPRPKVRHGLVVDEILQEAQEGDYQLVVIGTYCGSGWRRILLDDLAHQIIVKADRPVLVVR
jgi:nucleotide-binding universal stress UspA family protein